MKRKQSFKLFNIKKLLPFSQENIVNAIVLIAIFIFLINYFKPDLILLGTTTAGGDTATHTYPAKYMYEYLLPHGKVVGWCPGWYAGFPLFRFYFPLPFVLMGVLAPFLTIEVAFKIVTVLGTFMLPACALIAMKLMGFKFPTPTLAAVFTLPFLFMEANSMWGGNIPSTLAGEFSFSFSFAITLVFLGLMYRGINADKSSAGPKSSKKFVLHNAVLFAAVILSHLYTMLFAGLASLFFLIKRKSREIAKNFLYLFKTYGLSLLLVSFWLLPFVARLEYTTTYNYVWKIDDLKEVFPEILMPFYVIAIMSFGCAAWKRDSRILFIAFSILTTFLLYSLAHEIGVVDIRFVPFIQFFPLLISAYGIGKLLEAIFNKTASNKVSRILQISLTIIVMIAVMFWVSNHTNYIAFWIKWNYEGFEQKTLWSAYNAVNEYLKGTVADPRVVYEHSPLHDAAGSIRAFENLPLFSGRSTLEGLHMPSTPTSPFVFYIQSQISEVTSCPLPGWACTTYNSASAAKRLELFNVKNVIARSDIVKSDLASNPMYKLNIKIEPYEIYELVKNKNKYVVVPDYEPVVFEAKDFSSWRYASYEWFKRDDLLDVPLVFIGTDAIVDGREFSLRTNDLDKIPRVPLNLGNKKDCNVEEIVKEEEVRIHTDCIGVPHIIRISYFPNWQVEGADKVYPVSPSFMLIFPKKEDVRVYYGETLVDRIGINLSALGILGILFCIIASRGRFRNIFKINNFNDDIC